jgi:hypothetical protein
VGKEGAEPPLRIVPTKTNREEGEVRPTVKIKYLSGDSQLLPVYDGTDRHAEALLKHILLFNEAANKTGIVPEYKLCKAFLDDKKAKLDEIDALGDPSESNIIRKIDNVDVAKSQREWLVYDIKCAVKKIEVLTERYYSLWEKLLATDLHPDWNTIVHEECETEGYIVKGGTRKSGKRGITIENIWYCFRAWLLLVVSDNAAELNKQYLQNQIYKSDAVSIWGFFARVVELNQYSQYLPTLKDIKDAPKDLPRGDIPLNEVDLCLALLRAMPRWLNAAYVAKQGVNHCPTSVEQLKKDLLDVEPQARQFKKVADDVKALKSGSPNKKPSGSEGGTANASGTSKKRSLKDPIPKKVRNDKTEGKESLLDSYKKHCNHCQRFSPKIAHTHNTKDCRRWNPDGTPKAKKAKTSHALQKLEHEQFKAVFAQMQEDNKKLRKLLKKQTKKSKSRKRKAYDTSDDSGSDSSE